MEPALRLDESSIDAFDLPNRRPTHIVNTPALIAHFVFWPSRGHPNWERAAHQAVHSTDPDIALACDGRNADSRVVVASALNAYLKRFRRKIGPQSRCRVPLFTCDPDVERRSQGLERGRDAESRPGAAEPTPYVMYDRTLALEGEVRDFIFEITADIYSEQFSLSFRLFPAAAPRDALREGSALSRVQRILRDLVDPNPGELEWMRDGRHQDYRRPPDADMMSERQLAADSLRQADAMANDWLRLLYTDIWAEFFDTLRDAFEESQSFDPAELVEPPGMLPGALAGVFRNMVIRTMPDAEQDACQNERPRKSERRRNQPGDPQDELPVIEGDRSLVLRNVPPGVLGHIHERAELALDGFASAPHKETYRQIRMRVTEHLNHRSVLFGRLLGYRARSRWIEDLQSGNAALSSVLDGLAVHGSTLGIHTHPDQHFPHREVRHFVIYGGPSRQQLGRLIRNLHAVGEYRLLALRGHRDIEDASRELDAVWPMLASVETALEARQLEEANRRLQEAGEELARIKTSVSDGGLEHRLRQPATCMTHLNRFLDALRVRRIEGWRPFGDFIARSVAPHVTYMQSVEAKLESLEAGLRAAEARVISQSLADNTSVIAGLQHFHKRINLKMLRQGERVDALTWITAGLGLLAASDALAGTIHRVPVIFGEQPFDPTIVNDVIGAFALIAIALGLWRSAWSLRAHPKRDVDEERSER